MPQLSPAEEQVRSIISIQLAALKQTVNTLENPSPELTEFKAVLDVWIGKLKVGGEEKIC